MKATKTTTLALNDLVQFTVQVVKATSPKKAQLDNAGPNGGKVKQLKIEEGFGTFGADDTYEGPVLTEAKIQKGLATPAGFKPIPKDALEAITEATKLDKMLVEEFVPLERVPFERATGFHFIQPKDGLLAYRLLYERMLERQVAAVTKWTARSRQQLMVLYADERYGAIVGNTLTFATDAREPDDAVRAALTVEPKPEMLAMTDKLIDQMLGEGQAIEDAVDDAVVQTQDLIEKAMLGEAIEAPEVPAEPQATDDEALIAALAASVQDAPAAKANGKGKGKKPAKKAVKT